MHGAVHGDGNVVRHGRSQCVELFNGNGNVVRLARGQCVELFMAMATSCELAEAKTVCPTGGHSSERMASWMTL